jgi:hypothetical protein
MAGLISLGVNILLVIWFLLIVTRRVGKRPGQDPKYDAYLAVNGPTFRLLGIGWIILGVVGLVVDLIFFRG